MSKIENSESFVVFRYRDLVPYLNANWDNELFKDFLLYAYFKGKLIDEISVLTVNSTLTSHVSTKLYLYVRNDEYIILTILVAIPRVVFKL